MTGLFAAIKGHDAEVEGGPYTPEEFSMENRMDGPPPGGDGKGPGGPTPGGKDDGGAPPGMAGSSSGGASAGMSIHKSEGLVPINERGESNIPGFLLI